MVEKNYKERNNMRNQHYVQKYIQHYLNDTHIMNIAQEKELISTLLPYITVDAINAYLGGVMKEDNVMFSFMLPLKEEVVVPDSSMIIALWHEARGTEMERQEDEKVEKRWLTNTPKRGKIKSVTKNEELGTTQYKLSNGIQVVIKPTDFKDDEIMMRGTCSGGLSIIEDLEKLPSGYFADMIVENNGLGEMNSVELNKALLGKNLSLSPTINQYSQSINGTSSVEDFETLMQLNYMMLTSPRKDDVAFERLIQIYKTMYANQESNPKMIFKDSVKLICEDYHPRRIVMNKELVGKLNQDAAIEIFESLYSNPYKYKFYIVGNIDPDDAKVQQIIATWLGGIKTKKHKRGGKDVGLRTVKGEKKSLFYQNMETDVATCRVEFSGEMERNFNNLILMRVISDILDLRYTETIREKEGGSYGVSTDWGLSSRPVNEGSITIHFDTDPKRYEEMLDVVYNEIRTLAMNGPTADELVKVQEALAKRYQVNLKSNSYWRNTVLPSYYGSKYNYLTDYLEVLNSITPEVISDVLKELVNQNNVTEIVMLPKEKAN